jgi:DHA1 family bicyclomycin/chloramphenicol resistance-like MFS transporter
MYLPAFPALETSLGSPSGTAQLTLATWFAGLSLGQFLLGALTDRFGRRAPLLAGTLIYTLGTAGCALSGSIATMAIWRFVSALGASASMIVPRAIVRDVSDGHEAARILAQLILVLGAAPILAPSLGGIVVSIASWRDIFWIMTAYGAAGFLITWRFVPDTLAIADRLPLNLAATILRSTHVLRERSFITHTLMLSASSFALFAYLGGSPVVFIGLYHFTPAAFAAQFGVIAATYILCSQLNIHAIRALGSSRVLSLASSIYLAGTGILMILASHPGGSPVLIALAIAIPLAATGFIAPTATVGALHHHAAHAGTASSLMGTLTFMIGATSGYLVGALTDGTARPMALLMLLGGIGLKAADLARPKRHS